MTEGQRVVLAVDAGGTKTVGLLVDGRGNPVARAEAGSGSHVNVGIDTVQAAIQHIVDEITEQDSRPIAAACLAMAGIDTPRDKEAVTRALERIIKAPHLLICNDSLAALRAGTDDSYGVVVNAGTGSIAMGINRQGEERRAGGWGYYLSDEGSGYFIGTEALKSVFKTADSRANGGLLADRILKYFAVSSSQELYQHLQGTRFKDNVAGVASLAREVQSAAGLGDKEALRILRVAGRELAALGNAVIVALGMEDEVFRLVMAGSIFRVGPPLTTEFRRKVSRKSPRADFVFLTREPVWGAVRLALDLLEPSSRSGWNRFRERELLGEAPVYMSTRAS